MVLFVGAKPKPERVIVVPIGPEEGLMQESLAAALDVEVEVPGLVQVRVKVWVVVRLLVC